MYIMKKCLKMMYNQNYCRGEKSLFYTLHRDSSLQIRWKKLSPSGVTFPQD